MKNRVCVALFSLTVGGCSSDKREPALLEGGAYESAELVSPDLSDVEVAGIKLELRKADMLATFTDVDGTETKVALAEVAEGEWGTNCATNVDTVPLETVALQMADVTVGDVTLKDPKLFAWCAGPEVLLGGEWTNCGAKSCDRKELWIKFEPVQ